MHNMRIEKCSMLVYRKMCAIVWESVWNTLGDNIGKYQQKYLENNAGLNGGLVKEVKGAGGGESKNIKSMWKQANERMR